MTKFRQTIPLLLATGWLGAQPVTETEATTATLPPAQKAVANLSPGNNATVRLRYDGDYGNYLRFYDERNVVVLLAFRRHRWDYRNNYLLHELQSGHEYQVTFQYEALRVIFPAPYEPLEQLLEKKEPPKPGRAIREADNYVLGRMVAYRPAALDDLRF